ncbi:hypothetical protein ACDL92_07765 [Ihubacter sp. mB4P-1]|uniref:hypothetical protein n=1 Tax=Ihubacter sp. mB4P-1 TaxID=3242370 RepID=UPI00137AF4A6
MKQIPENPFTTYIETLPANEQNKLNDFFTEFNMHCLMAKKEKKLLQTDFEQALLYYKDAGVPLDTALDLLDIRNLGGFYARPSILWFALDDAAKIYPLSMEHGSMSVFRLSVYLKKPVSPQLLQMALNFTIKRFPSFATTLKKGFFWHYLDTTKRRFLVEAEHDIPCQPLKVSLSGSQSFRVLYYENRISVEFFHVLTDGTGGMTFLKTLAAEYLRLSGAAVSYDETLWDTGETPDIAEFENAFAKVPLSETASGFIDKPAVQMSGRLSENKPCRVIHFKMDAADLKAASANYHTTITVYLLAQLFLAGKAATDELSGEASIQVPVNMRKFYPSKTVRNFSMYCGIRLPLSQITSLPAMIEAIDAQLKQKTDKPAMCEMLTATERLVGTLKYIPLSIKQPAAKMVYGFLGDKIFTNTLSNLGVVHLPDSVAAHIESMDFVLGTAITNRASCAVVTINDTAMLSVTKMTADPTFEEKLHALLSADGIRMKTEGSPLYEA